MRHVETRGWGIRSLFNYASCCPCCFHPRLEPPSPEGFSISCWVFHPLMELPSPDGASIHSWKCSLPSRVGAPIPSVLPPRVRAFISCGRLNSLRYLLMDLTYSVKEMR